jgi:hypothetical protein
MLTTLSDLDAFGHWLAGFTAGEGSFNLNVGAHQVSSQFTIKVRADDQPILEAVRQRWGGIGSLTVQPARGNSAPMAVYQVVGVRDLPVVLEHFENYPLRTCKARDFAHWSAAVKHHASVHARPFRRLGYCKGVAPKWTADDLSAYRWHVSGLHAGRVFQEPSPDVAPTVAVFDETFCHWLAGFIAAEGCLYLRLRARNTVPQARLQIKLRADDLSILLAIQQFFGSGLVQRETGKKGCPTYCYQADSADTIHNHVVPFLRSYPLRSRKSVEVPVWIAAANLCYQGHRRGNPQRQADLDTFRQLLEKLRHLKHFAV